MVVLTEVIDQKITKPFLGGWRHKDTGVEYLNAASQTGPRPETVPWNEKCTRGVQSAETKNQSTQAPRDVATQMWRRNCFVSTRTDKFMTAQPYETYDEMRLRLDFEGKARIIQRNYRVYRLLKYMSECAEAYRRMMENCAKRTEEQANLYRDRYKREILRKTYPQTRDDFDLLYGVIGQWREDRRRKTKSRFFEAAQRAEGLALLTKTVEMLNVIDRRKQAIKELHRKEKRVKFITENAKPVRWHGYKGKLVEMVTMKAQKAREFKSIYDSLSDDDVTVEKRMELLIMLKKSLEAHNCLVAFDAIDLLDQEIMLLSRGMKGFVLDYLRERIIYAYINFVSASGSCTCNNQKVVGRESDCENLRIPIEPKTMLCRGCSRLLPCTRFSAHSRIKKISYCISCTSLRQQSFGHVNYDPYMYLLNCVRAEEKRRNCNSALAFMMQREDIYHLVNTIWRGRSIVSENSNLFDLRIIRYRQDEEWSPWNCIVLTNEEAEIHCRMEDYSAVYSKHLLHKIFLAHQVAKSYFERLSAMETNFRESSRFYMIEDRIEYQPPLSEENYNPLARTSRSNS